MENEEIKEDIRCLLYEYKLTPEICYLIGVCWGDGNIEHNRIRFAVKDRRFIQKIANNLKISFKRHFFQEKKNNNGSYLYHINLNSTLMAKKFKTSLNDIESEEKEENLIAFLEGAFDSEGCVDKNRPRIRFAVKNERYAQIVSKSLNKLKIKHTFVKNKLDFYVIRIYGINDIIDFASKIHFSVTKRRSRLMKLILKGWKKKKKKPLKISKNAIKKLRRDLRIEKENNKEIPTRLSMKKIRALHKSGKF